MILKYTVDTPLTDLEVWIYSLHKGTQQEQSEVLLHVKKIYNASARCSC